MLCGVGVKHSSVFGRDRSQCSVVSVIHFNFHTSPIPHGRKNRHKLKQRFFEPRDRFFENQGNIWRRDNTNDTSHLGMITSTMYIPNHPMGDLYLKKQKPLPLPGDEIKRGYDRCFPEERLTILQRDRPEDLEWYKTPFERFYDMYSQLTKEGMTKEQALESCLKEKMWEAEAIEIEREICRRQAEELFGFRNNNLHETIMNGNPIENTLLSDPRVVEYETRLARDKLDELVQQRLKNPLLPKITLKKCGLPSSTVIDYITKNSGVLSTNLSADTKLGPEGVAVHFDESVYFGEIQDMAGQFFGKNIDSEGDLAKFLERSDDLKGAPIYPGVTMSETMDVTDGSTPLDFLKDKNFQEKNESEKMKIQLEYMDKHLQTWASDILQMFDDRLKPEDAKTPEERSDRLARNLVAKLQRHARRSHLDMEMERMGIMEGYDELPPSPTEQVIREGPVTQGPLAEELRSLFGKVSNKNRVD